MVPVHTKSQRGLAGAFVLGSLAATAFLVGPTPARISAAAATSSPPHIMLIVDENKAYSSAQGSPYIIGNPDAPYINGLANTYTSATQWFSNQHGSPADYLDLISGSDQGLSEGTGPPYTTPNLVDELNANHISWKAYMESMPSACYNGGTTGVYEADHNPFAYFSDYTSLCSGGNGVIPYSQSQMSTDLNSTSPPDFVWITPNICDDMHTNGGLCGTNAVVNGDTWLSTNLPTVLSSSWYASGGIIIITWDESNTADVSGGGYGTGGHIATVVISANTNGPFGSPGDHYATLRGIEEAYGVPLLGNSANPSFGDITPAFGTPVSAPPPVVTAISPTDGAQTDSALVTITGSNFGGSGFSTSDVHFGATNVAASNAYPCPGSSAGCFVVDSPRQISAYTPAGPSPGPVDVQVTTPGGTSPINVNDRYTYIAPGAYTAITPFRVCDTRSILPNNQCTGKTLGPHSTVTLQISGEHGLSGQAVPSNARAVVVNLTAIDESSTNTYVTAFPAGESVPGSSNINLSGRAVQANLAVVQLSPSGQMSVFNALGNADTIVDVQGYFAPPSAPPVAGKYHSIAPLRICDTRSNTNTECAGTTDNPLPANTWRRVRLSGVPPGTQGAGSIPSDGTAAAAVFNLTATQGTKATYLSVEPPNGNDQCPTGPPPASNLNPAAGSVLPNRVVAPLGPLQDVCVYNSLGSIDFIIDVNGWFGDGAETGTGALFYSLPPTRICDTRAGSGTPCAGKPLTSNSVETVRVLGVATMPAIGATPQPVAVVANLTGVAGTAATYLTLYPSDVATPPRASDLNPGAGVAIANLAIVGLATSGSSTGDVNLYNAVGTIGAILDVAGWFQ